MKELPHNLLCSEYFNGAIHVKKPRQMVALLNRGIVEQSSCLKWLYWPSDFNHFHSDSWVNSQHIWKVLFVPAFKKGESTVKTSMLMLISYLLTRHAYSDVELLQIAISLAAFNRSLRESALSHMNLDSLLHLIRKVESQISFQNSNDLKTISEYFGSPQNVINTIIKESKTQSAIRHHVAQLETTLKFLTRVDPDSIVGDWTVNLLFVHRRVLKTASLNLFQKVFMFALNRKATDEGVCAILELFREAGVEEELRFELQNVLPSERIPRIWKICSASIAQPTSFVLFSRRRAHFLAASRGFSQVPIYYSLPEFDLEEQTQVLLVSLLYYIGEEDFDVFESQNVWINEMSLKIFLEETLLLFTEVEHWSIPAGPDGMIVPSPALQPVILSTLALLLIRCRQIECNSPFKFPKELFLGDVKGLSRIIIDHFNKERSEEDSWPALHPGYLSFFDIFVEDCEFEDEDLWVSQVKLEKSWNQLILAEPEGEYSTSPEFSQKLENRIETIIGIQLEALQTVFEQKLKYFSKEECYKLLFE